MERIGRLLFAVTVILVFSYLLVFYSLANAGNGGEYWGFSRNVEGADAARESFEQGDFRFLSVKMLDHTGKDVWYVPAVVKCADNPYGERAYSRRSDDKPLHGEKSFAIADRFAREYNRALAWEMRTQADIDCEVFLDM